MKLLYIDTACAAFPSRAKDAPPWEPHCVRVAALLEDDGGIVGGMTHLIKPLPTWTLADDAAPYHRATPANFRDEAVDLPTVAAELAELLCGVDVVVSHNATFHNRMLFALFADAGVMELPEWSGATFCTLNESQPICRLNPQRLGRWKAPKLSEAYLFFTAVDMDPTGAWNDFAEEQVDAVRAVYHGIKKKAGVAA